MLSEESASLHAHLQFWVPCINAVDLPLHHGAYVTSHSQLLTDKADADMQNGTASGH